MKKGLCQIEQESILKNYIVGYCLPLFILLIVAFICKTFGADNETVKLLIYCSFIPAINSITIAIGTIAILISYSLKLLTIITTIIFNCI